MIGYGGSSRGDDGAQGAESLVGFGPDLPEFEQDEIHELLRTEGLRYIKDSKKISGKALITYTRVLHNGVDDIIKNLEDICAEQTKAFKITASLGFIIRSIVTDELSFRYASSNTAIHPEPVFIQKRSDIGQYINDVREVNWDSYYNVPRSEFVVARIVYLLVWVFRTSVNLGCRKSVYPLPAAFKNSKYIMDPSNKHQKKDNCHNLCIFRCCALFLERYINGNARAKEAPKKLINELYTKFCFRINYQKSKNLFPGVDSQTDIGYLEDIMNCDIALYRLEPDPKSPDTKITATPIRLPSINPAIESRGVVYLGVYKAHCFLLINNLRAINDILCPLCQGYLTEIKSNFNKHFNLCSKRANSAGVQQDFVYQEGQACQSQKSVFETIEFYFPQFKIDPEIRNVNFISAFDMECLFKKFRTPVARSQVSYFESKLVAYAGGVCSNVEGFEEVEIFYSDENERPLGAVLVDYLLEIQRKQYAILRRRFSDVFDFLDSELEKAECREWTEGIKVVNHLLISLYKLITILPVFCYNFSRFDYRLIRSELLLYLIEKFSVQNVNLLVVKNKLKKITTPKLMFLDCLSFNGGGSYDNFTYKITQKRQKLLLPYDHFTDLSVLNETELPPVSAWTSQLKNCNLLGQELELYNYLVEKKGKTKEQAFQIIGCDKMPLNAENKLKELKQIWEEKNFRTMRDWVNWYISFDLAPLVHCMDVLSGIYHKKYDVNLYREYIGLPGLAMSIALKKLGDHALYVPSTRSYELLRKGLVGGASILHTLVGEAGLTRLKDGPNLMGSAFAWDCGLLYGYCLQRIPYGVEIVRTKENNFKPEIPVASHKSGYHSRMILNYYSWKYGNVFIKSRLNGGEVRLINSTRAFRPDGYTVMGGRKRALEINGCASHLCSVHPCLGDPDEEIHPVCKLTYSEIKAKDEARLKELSYEFDSIKVVEICEFLRDYVNPRTAIPKKLKQFSYFLRDNPEFAEMGSKKALTEQQIYRLVLEGKCTGLILADWTTPEHLRDYYEEFPLFFHNAMIKAEDCSPLQQKWFKTFGVFKKPQRQLIANHEVKNHLIGTDLAQFYLQRGAVPSNLQFVMEWALTDRLKPWVDEACELRYQASLPGQNHELSLLGEAAKLVVLSFYGRTLLRQDQYKTTSLDTENTTLRKVLGTNFYQSDHIGELDGENYYENRVKKRKIKFNSALHVGSFILSNSKLLMLKLFYNLVKPNIMNNTFEIFCLQTDSLSFFISEKTVEDFLEKCVIPGREKHLKRAMMEYLTDPGNPRSKFTAGLFKVEWTATKCVGVTSKAYVCEKTGETGGGILAKQAFRGVPSSALADCNSARFLEVLMEQIPIHVTLRSFTYLHGELFYEVMRKRALYPNYSKRWLTPEFKTYTLTNLSST